MSNVQKKMLNSDKPGGMPGGPPMMRGGEKPKNLKETLLKLSGYIGKYKLAIIFVMLLAAFSSIFGIIGPKLMGMATDVIYNAIEKSFSQGSIKIDYTALWGVIALMSGLYVASYVFSLIQGFIMAKISNKVTYNLRKDVNKKIKNLPLNYFDKTATGDVLSRITNDVDSISQSLTQSLTQLTSSLTLIIGTIYMMFSISFSLTIIAFLVVPVSMFLISKIVKISQPLFKQQQKSLGDLNGHIEEMLSSHTVVKSFNLEKKSLEQFEKYNNELCASAWKSQFASHTMMPLTNFVSNIGYVIVCIVGAGLANTGKLTVGSILSFIQYVRNFNQPIQQIANISTILQSAVACAERIFEFIEQDEEEKDDEHTVSTDNILGTVEFKNVTFGYNNGETVIDNFSLKVVQGEKIAIVGPTGAGKTTIVKLLMRYYEINSGEILIDGINIKNFARNDLRKMFGMVLQDTWLFKGSIKDNIAYSNDNATMDEIIQSAKIGQVHHFVKALPKGYDFELNEETSNISQGQKQLLTIARAFLQNPKILILDEATSSVDTRTEVQIQQATQNLMQNRTSFVIAHRLSTIRDADKILVMNEGEIIEIGNHSQLIEKNGFYAKLYQSQFENQE